MIDQWAQAAGISLIGTQPYSPRPGRPSVREAWCQQGARLVEHSPAELGVLVKGLGGLVTAANDLVERQENASVAERPALASPRQSSAPAHNLLKLAQRRSLSAARLSAS